MQGVYINGKEQIIELLQYLPAEERERLLKNIRVRNPQMASELSEQSLSFNSLENLSTTDLKTLMRNIPAPIMGLALQDSQKSFQKKILMSAERSYAEEVYEVMTTISRGAQDIKRAKNKVLETAIGLYKKKIILS